MRSSLYQSLVVRLPGSARSLLSAASVKVRRIMRPAPPMLAQVKIDPDSHVTELEGAEPTKPALSIGVRLTNARAEVTVPKEALHE